MLLLEMTFYSLENESFDWIANHAKNRISLDEISWAFYTFCLSLLSLFLSHTYIYLILSAEEKTLSCSCKQQTEQICMHRIFTSMINLKPEWESRDNCRLVGVLSCMIPHTNQPIPRSASVLHVSVVYLYTYVQMSHSPPRMMAVTTRTWEENRRNGR